jgi:hypothetical protein
MWYLYIYSYKYTDISHVYESEATNQIRIESKESYLAYLAYRLRQCQSLNTCDKALSGFVQRKIYFIYI